MKFTSILTVLLIFIIAIAHAAPVKQKLGPHLKTLGVSFEDSYRNLNSQVKTVEKKYKKKIASFAGEAKEAAAKDGTEVPEFLTTWNDNYHDLSVQYIAISKQMDHKIKKLGDYLKTNS